MPQPEIHPWLPSSSSVQRAAMLDMQGNRATLGDAIGMLAAWMEACKDKLTEDDLVVLSEVGGMLYRVGLGRKK